MVPVKGSHDDPLSWSVTLQYYGVIWVSPHRNTPYTVKHHPLVRGGNNSLGCHSSDKDTTQAPLTATLHAGDKMGDWCVFRGDRPAVLWVDHHISVRGAQAGRTLSARRAMPRQSGHFCFCSPLLLLLLLLVFWGRLQSDRFYF